MNGLSMAESVYILWDGERKRVLLWIGMSDRDAAVGNEVLARRGPDLRYRLPADVNLNARIRANGRTRREK